MRAQSVEGGLSRLLMSEEEMDWLSGLVRQGRVWGSWRVLCHHWLDAAPVGLNATS